MFKHNIEKKEYRGTNLNIDFYKDFLTEKEALHVFNILEKQVKWG